VEVDILPLATDPLPHTCLFCRDCQWAPAAVDLLLEAHVAHNSSICTQQPHLWQQQQQQQQQQILQDPDAVS
jgi:hypothetical protein